MTENKVEVAKSNLAKADYGYISITNTPSPWTPEDIDKLSDRESRQPDEYHKIVKESRFFYRKDPIASTVINKLIEIGLTELTFDKGKLSQNELRIFEGMKQKLQDFAEACAMEYLISGLIIPEIKYTPVSAEVIKEMGIKKYNSLVLPTSMWIRDPETIKINSSLIMDEPSYFVKVPDKLIFFITTGGKYEDGTSDPELFAKLLAEYPEFVAAVRSGEIFVLLDNDLIIRRRVLSDSPYPVPYLYPALESLRHKRNLRKMDYSVASRVISAIQLFKLGNDEFPVTEDDEEAFDSIKDQIMWRNSGGKDVERIFQLFANHTLEIEWIMPDVEVLLNDKKYIEVNDDIFLSLGFPRILTTGETQRTGTSDPEFATLSPVKTMVNMQKKVLVILKAIIRQISTENRIPEPPNVRFKPISLHSFANFIAGLRNLYDTRNISRTTYADAFGYNLEEEVRTMATEKDIYTELGVEEFAPKPFSVQPGAPEGNQSEPNQNKKGENTNPGRQ